MHREREEDEIRKMGGIDREGDRATLSGEEVGRTKSEGWPGSLGDTAASRRAVMRSCVTCFDGSRKTK